MLVLIALLVSGCVPQAMLPQEPLPKDLARVKSVLVVANENSKESLEVADYYIKRRKIPTSNLVKVKVSSDEEMTFSEFETELKKPVKGKILISKNRIDFIVLTKGIPIRFKDKGSYSVDGHLGAMDLPIEAIKKPGKEQILGSFNPYFSKNEPFSSTKFGFYLVSRLDGYSVDSCKKLVDNSIAARAWNGLFFFDGAANRESDSYGVMQAKLKRANDVLKTKKFDSQYDSGKEFICPTVRLAGYASWGSNDGAYNVNFYRALRFKPGSLVETFVSTSGRTFRPGPNPGQSLIADLIDQGATGLKGYVSEPFTFALAEPDIVFDRYTSGFNLAESFYMASKVLKWKDIVIGDPICNPYFKGEKAIKHP